MKIHAPMTVVFRGDGRRTLAEIVVAELKTALENPRSSWIEAFREHPVLRSTDPTELSRSLSRKRAARWIESDFFPSGWESGEEADSILARGREIEATLPFSLILGAMDLFPPEPASQAPPCEILYQDDGLLAVMKPSGIPSSPLRSDETDSVVQRVLAVIADLPILRGNPLEPGLVHRLDTGTSGVLLFAKNREAFERLQEVWNSGGVVKEYHALIGGKVPLGRCELLLGHDEKAKRKMRVLRTPEDRKRIRGEPLRAISEILEVKTLSSGERDIRIRIETGVHHQIRATLAHFGSPIRGDSLYGGVSSERLWLHASKLGLPDRGGKPLEIFAPLPPEWPEVESQKI